MKKQYSFEKDPDGAWYIVLPEWPGDRGALLMVMNADVMLDMLAQGGNWVDLEISTSPFEDQEFELEFLKDDSMGGWYKMKNHNTIPEIDMWLCSVTRFVFDGILPKNIYVKHLN